MTTVCDVLSIEQVQSWFKPRPHNAHKGMFGKVLVIGGDHGMPGAVRLAAEAALRVGSGLVTVVTREDHVLPTVVGCPELLCYGLENDWLLLESLIEGSTVLIVGPGLGQSRWSKQLFDIAISHSLPMIVDADGLNWLTKHDYCRRDNWILTPHPGEAARLIQSTTQLVQGDRVQTALRIQHRYGGVVVLKGSETLIAGEQQTVQRCLAGNPGMASPGMGDLLTGVIAGLVAQGYDLWRAAKAGVQLHATAADQVAAKQGERGMLASDLLLEFPPLVNPKV